jgi:hypothetical protein
VEAERRVWEFWSHVAQRTMGCEMRVESELTEEYEWGWMVFLAPVRPEDCRHSYPFCRYAIDRREGDSTPVGTKGLTEALIHLKVVTEKDLRGRTRAEVEAMWERQTRRCT